MPRRGASPILQRAFENSRTAMTLPAARASVGRGRFHAVDDQDLNGRAAWFEPKPKLLLDGGEQRRDVIVCRWLRRAWRQPFDGEPEIDVVWAGEPGAVDDAATGEVRQRVGEVTQ